MEEKLSSLNTAIESVDRLGQEAMDSTPTPGFENLPPPRTGEMYDQESSYGYEYRPRTTSLDMFNDNMARLFQDVGINDTQVIPVLDETVPLTLTEESEKDFADANVDGSDGLNVAYSHSNSDEGMNAKLEGEEIPHDSDDTNGGKMKQPHMDVEVGMQQKETSDQPSMLRTESNGSTPVRRNSKIRKKKRSLFFRFFQKIGVVQNLDDFLKPRTHSIWKFMGGLFWLCLAALAAAVILFYVVGNPPTGIVDFEASKRFNSTVYQYVTTEGRPIKPYNEASYSWWVLFACVRLPITFALARFLVAFFIDFLILERRCVVSCMGPTFTLLVVQSKVS
jgi:hypothetical protein